MIRKTVVAVLTVCCALTSATVATAEAAPPAPQWVPVFYFGTQTHCAQAGAVGLQTGALRPGTWRCDSGWLMVRPPQMG